MELLPNNQSMYHKVCKQDQRGTLPTGGEVPAAKFRIGDLPSTLRQPPTQQLPIRDHVKGGWIHPSSNEPNNKLAIMIRMVQKQL
jgi:hypothetical protein